MAANQKEDSGSPRQRAINRISGGIGIGWYRKDTALGEGENKERPAAVGGGGEIFDPVQQAAEGLV
jgi:hypothetical protein